jgi:hypothetical protein
VSVNASRLRIPTLPSHSDVSEQITHHTEHSRAPTSVLDRAICASHPICPEAQALPVARHVALGVVVRRALPGTWSATFAFLARRIGEVDELPVDRGSVGPRGPTSLDQGGPRWLGWRNRLRWGGEWGSIRQPLRWTTT